MSSELNRPKLLFRIVKCSCPFLFTQFAQRNQDYTLWQFTTIMKFLDEQIVNLQFKEGHTSDISTITSKKKSNKNVKVTSASGIKMLGRTVCKLRIPNNAIFQRVNNTQRNLITRRLWEGAIITKGRSCQKDMLSTRHKVMQQSSVDNF